jgi:hypothetical protein
MTQPQEVLRNYQQLLLDNNTVQQGSFSSVVLNDAEIQGGNNKVAQQTKITQRRKKNPIQRFDAPLVVVFKDIVEGSPSYLRYLISDGETTPEEVLNDINSSILTASKTFGGYYVHAYKNDPDLTLGLLTEGSLEFTNFTALSGNSFQVFQHGLYVTLGVGVEVDFPILGCLTTSFYFREKDSSGNINTGDTLRKNTRLVQTDPEGNKRHFLIYLPSDASTSVTITNSEITVTIDGFDEILDLEDMIEVRVEGSLEEYWYGDYSTELNPVRLGDEYTWEIITCTFPDGWQYPAPPDFSTPIWIPANQIGVSKAITATYDLTGNFSYDDEQDASFTRSAAPAPPFSIQWSPPLPSFTVPLALSPGNIINVNTSSGIFQLLCIGLDQADFIFQELSGENTVYAYYNGSNRKEFDVESFRTPVDLFPEEDDPRNDEYIVFNRVSGINYTPNLVDGVIYALTKHRSEDEIIKKQWAAIVVNLSGSAPSFSVEYFDYTLNTDLEIEDMSCIL